MADEKERKTLEERNQMSDLDRLRHSCAHVMATAISRLWSDAQFAAGPPVEGGFYYDLELSHQRLQLQALWRLFQRLLETLQGLNQI